ncbi:hypothetical protein D3C86_2148350 [compost metagenome]
MQILGFGSEGMDGAAAAPSAPGASAGRSNGPGEEVSYRPDHMVQIVGRGDLSASQKSALSADEREHLGL